MRRGKYNSQCEQNVISGGRKEDAKRNLCLSVDNLSRHWVSRHTLSRRSSYRPCLLNYFHIASSIVLCVILAGGLDWGVSASIYFHGSWRRPGQLPRPPSPI